MNFVELQSELRNISEHIVVLEQEIEYMKPKTEQEQKSDFDMITKLANEYPIRNNELLKADEVVRKEYVKCIGFITLSNRQKVYEKLLYLTRISKGIKNNDNADEIYEKILGYNKNDFEKMLNGLFEYRYSLILDIFIILNIASDVTEENVLAVIDIGKLLGIESDEMRVIAILAKAVVTNDFEVLKKLEAIDSEVLDLRWSSKFLHYIPEQFLASDRIIYESVYENREIFEKICSKDEEDKYQSINGIYISSIGHSFRTRRKSVECIMGFADVENDFKQDKIEQFIDEDDFLDDADIFLDDAFEEVPLVGSLVGSLDDSLDDLITKSCWNSIYRSTYRSTYLLHNSHMNIEKSDSKFKVIKNSIPCRIIYHVESGMAVKKGEVIISYERFKVEQFINDVNAETPDTETVEIRAEKSGIVFIDETSINAEQVVENEWSCAVIKKVKEKYGIKDKNGKMISAYIVSCFDDYEKLVKLNQKH